MILRYYPSGFAGGLVLAALLALASPARAQTDRKSVV